MGEEFRQRGGQEMGFQLAPLPEIKETLAQFQCPAESGDTRLKLSSGRAIRFFWGPEAERQAAAAHQQALAETGQEVPIGGVYQFNGGWYYLV